jgi:hypothetical protein
VFECAKEDYSYFDVKSENHPPVWVTSQSTRASGGRETKRKGCRLLPSHLNWYILFSDVVNAPLGVAGSEIPIDNLRQPMENQFYNSFQHIALSQRWQRNGQMARTKKKIAMIGIWLGLLLLSACNTSTPTSTPTIDLNPFRTEVASTVLAQVTQAVALTPSTTPVPSPTATLAPSSTPAQPTTTSNGTQATLASETPGTPTADLAEWVSQSVADGTVFAPGEAFTITWRLKNAGTSTWTPAYLFRFYSGNAFGAPQEILLGREVAPGETVEISISMEAPTALGDYRSDWVMSNELRSNFKQPVYLEITVARPATVTPTTTAMATAPATASVTP